jgi:hypothetical protein
VALSLGDVSWGPDDVAEAARKWVSEVSRARKRARKLRRGTYMEIRYEDLVTEPERVLRRVSDFVGLPWNDAMLDYHRGARERMRTEFRELKPLGGGTITAEERMRQHVLVWEPPSPSRAGRWKSDMPRADREAFESVAGKLLADLGYETRA